MPNASSVRRIAGLMATMSLEERISQLCCLDPAGLMLPDGSVDVDAVRKAAPVGIGHVYLTPELGEDGPSLRRSVAALTNALRDLSPQGIPPLFHAEALNGLVHPSGTQFATPLALASTWQPSLIERMADATRQEMLDVGILHALSPNLDITRDPRWGRVHETYGEDPELAATMGVAFVRGLQGPDLAEGVAATAKHFVGYGQSQGGLNHGATNLGNRVIREEFARPFEWAIRQAGLASVMNSYSELDGVPVIADRSLLTHLLRERLGFDGVVVSDYYSVAMLQLLHGVAATPRDAGRLAIEAGLDVEYPRPDTFSFLEALIEAGELAEELVDRAAARVLSLKLKLGLVLPGRIRERPVPSSWDRPQHRKLSREIADRALVLLTHDGTLPLTSGQRIAVVGTLAQSTRIHYGGYTATAFAEFGANPIAVPDASYVGAFLVAHRNPFPDEAEKFEDISRAIDAQSSTVFDSLAKRLDSGTDIFPISLGGPEGVDRAGLDVVTEQLSGADVAVVVVGERTGWSGALATAGEGRDRQSLELPGDQTSLVETVASTGIPTVVILVCGRPLDLTRIVATGATILFAPLLASDGPEAIAAALVGETVPGGKLPITWPRSAGQIPVFGRSRAGSGYQHPSLTVPGYIDGSGTPLFPFGHGLSYSTFAYESIVVPSTVDISGTIPVTVVVTNTSATDAEEVVQVYARDVQAQVTRPVRQLLAFARVAVPGGRSVEISFTIPVDTLAMAGINGRLVLEPGEIELFCGGSRADLPLTTATWVTGEPRDVDQTAGSRPFSAVTRTMAMDRVGTPA